MSGSEDNTSKTVFVGSLSWGTTEDGLREFFESCGKVTSTRIPLNERQQSRGYGFVEFETEDEAQKACEKDGAELDGRQIKVNISQPRGERRGGDRSERRGGDRYGGDRRGGDRYNDRRGGDRRGGDRYSDRRERY